MAYFTAAEFAGPDSEHPSLPEMHASGTFPTTAGFAKWLAFYTSQVNAHLGVTANLAGTMELSVIAPVISFLLTKRYEYERSLLRENPFQLIPLRLPMLTHYNELKHALDQVRPASSGSKDQSYAVDTETGSVV